MKQPYEGGPVLKINDIMDALAKLGYPEQGRLDAAKRMSWVPELARDMIEFVRQGCPQFDSRTGLQHQTLLRPLNDGLTVGLLMIDYLQSPSSAFLLGAALITHREEALAMLEKMVTDGLYALEPNGKYVNRRVPAERKYPPCPGCGTPLVRRSAFCRVCGSPTGIAPDQPA